jgi:hypothetical protein
MGSTPKRIEAAGDALKPGRLAMEPVGISRFPAMRPGAGLGLSGIDKIDGLVLTATYSTDRFSPDDVRGMMDALRGSGLARFPVLIALSLRVFRIAS